MKPIYMETSRTPQQCAEILQQALSAAEAQDQGDCRLRQVGEARSIQFNWQGRLSLGVDLAPHGERTFVRIRYALLGVARWAMLACLPITFGAFLLAGWLLEGPLIPGMSNLLVFGGIGLVLAFMEAAVFWSILALPALKLMKELGKALGAEEVAPAGCPQATEAFAELDRNAAA